MEYGFLALSTAFAASGSIAGALFNRKTGNRQGAAPYTLAVMLSALLSWAVLFALNPQASWRVLPYALAFAVCFVLTNAALVRALSCGPIAVTSLLQQLSLLGVTVWGFFFWNTRVTWTVGVGLTLIAISLWLCLRPDKKKPQSRPNGKWLLCTAVVFLGNAGCSITQRTQQMRFEGKYGSFLMLLAMAFSVLCCLALCLRAGKDAFSVLRGTWLFPMAAGVSNAVLNLLVIALASSSLSPSLIYPVIAVGGLTITTFCSALLFREKLHWRQWLGVFIGIAAVTVLSI